MKAVSVRELRHRAAEELAALQRRLDALVEEAEEAGEARDLGDDYEGDEEEDEEC